MEEWIIFGVRYTVLNSFEELSFQPCFSLLYRHSLLMPDVHARLLDMDRLPGEIPMAPFSLDALEQRELRSALEIRDWLTDQGPGLTMNDRSRSASNCSLL